MILVDSSLVKKTKKGKKDASGFKARPSEYTSIHPSGRRSNISVRIPFRFMDFLTLDTTSVIYIIYLLNMFWHTI